MRRFWIGILAGVLVTATGVSVPAVGQRRMRKYKAPPPMAQVTVTVVHGKDSVPLQNAAVVFHPRDAEGKDDGNMELKTNEQGQATLGIIEVGSKLLLQVIAPGYRTFGAEYDVPTNKKAITVKLLPPNQQYSIYAKNPANSDVRTNVPQTQMGHAAPADSPLLVQPDKKKHSDDDE
jgi:hypothetical protein